MYPAMYTHKFFLYLFSFDRIQRVTRPAKIRCWYCIIMHSVQRSRGEDSIMYLNASIILGEFLGQELSLYYKDMKQTRTERGSSDDLQTEGAKKTWPL